MRPRISHLLLLALILSFVVPQAAIAQVPDRGPDGTAAHVTPPVWVSTNAPLPGLVLSGSHELLGGRSVPETLVELQPILHPGQEVIVLDQSGNEVRGRVASLSDSTLVLVRRRFLHSEAWQASEPSIRRIKVVDSSSDGAGIGLAVALGGMAVNWKICSPNCGTLWGLPWMFAAPVAMLIGLSIDGAHNGVVYAPASRAPRIAFAPMVGHGQAGVLGQISF